MSGPPFTMSKYASETDLLRDKCAWLEGQLAEKVSALSETVKWVSVSERVPEDGVRVLGFWPTPEDEPMSASSYGITVRRNGSWYNADDDDDLYGDASHWMPLPEAPK